MSASDAAFQGIPYAVSAARGTGCGRSRIFFCAVWAESGRGMSLRKKASGIAECFSSAAGMCFRCRFKWYKVSMPREPRPHCLLHGYSDQWVLTDPG